VFIANKLHVSSRRPLSRQEAQLSHTDRSMLRVIEYFAKSLNVIRNGTIRNFGRGFLFAFHSNYGSILYHVRDKARYL